LQTREGDAAVVHAVAGAHVFFVEPAALAEEAAPLGEGCATETQTQKKRNKNLCNSVPPWHPSLCLSAAVGSLVGGEAVEQSRAAGRHQILLAAPAARVRRVPRRVPAALPVAVSQLRDAGRGAARPV